MKQSFSGLLKQFPQQGGWYYITVPKTVVEKHWDRQERGLIPITATIQQMTWHTSMLPKGDGTHFVAVPKNVREAYSIRLGDAVTITFVERNY